MGNSILSRFFSIPQKVNTPNVFEFQSLHFPTWLQKKYTFFFKIYLFFLSFGNHFIIFFNFIF